VWVDLRHADGMLRIAVTDSGRGGARPMRPRGARPSGAGHLLNISQNPSPNPKKKINSHGNAGFWVHCAGIDLTNF